MAQCFNEGCEKETGTIMGGPRAGQPYKRCYEHSQQAKAAYAQKSGDSTEAPKATKPMPKSRAKSYEEAGRSANWSGLAQHIVTPYLLQARKWADGEWDQFKTAVVKLTNQLFSAKEEGMKELE